MLNRMERSARPFDLVIAAAADTLYAWPAALALLSGAAHCAGRVACLLVGDSLDPDLGRKLAATFSARGVHLELVPVDLSRFDSLPTTVHLTRAAYGRLIVPAAAADLAARTLYLDSDTLVVGGLDPLIDLPLTAGHAAAAVQTGTAGGWYGVLDRSDFGIPPDAPFFNSGVILIDNSEWTHRAISERVIAHLEAAPETSTFADQGTLNAVLHDCWTPLHSSWNRTIRRSPSVRLGPVVASRRVLINLRATRVLHFCEGIKPWAAEYPPGAMAAVYRSAWRRFLPVPIARGRTFREWLHNRHPERAPGQALRRGLHDA